MRRKRENIGCHVVPLSATMKYALLIVAAILTQNTFGANINLRRLKRQSCGSNQFQCDSGQCISRFDVCDGIVNCNDGSDETSRTCQIITCPPFAFRCTYGACVNGNAKCNGQKDCPDDSDEHDCLEEKIISSNSLCKRNDFRCKSGICIDNFLICDGTQDCDDGSDETIEVCGSFRCPPLGFRCDYGGCIDIVGLCNGVKQCADGSDEKEERCDKNTSDKTTNNFVTSTTLTPSFGCQLPPQPTNGQYMLGGCKPPRCHPVPGKSVQTGFIIYKCNAGFALLGAEVVLCDNGWLSSFPTCTQASCPPLINPTREIECKLNGKIVECDKPVVPGTKAIATCNRYYTNVKEFSDFDSVCQHNGQWTHEITPCFPKCGEPNPDGLPLVAGGVKAKYGEYPWHAGIFRWIDEVTQQVCGGSIISESVIVTAAHCFWDVTKSERLGIEQFKIAVGKFYRKWNRKDEKYIQTSEISKLVLHDRFRGEQRQWENDIALVILETKILMTIAVRPVCVDYKKKYNGHFLPGKKGVVVGWGTTETQRQSDTLRTAMLPYVAFEDCEKAVPQSFLDFLTYDRFCAGYLNGTSVCPGDSGGGYATQFRDSKWYLMGIVSIGVPTSNANACNVLQYTTFTRVSDYYEFIQDNNS